MTAFLWHFTALVAVHAGLWVAGVDLAGNPATARFWWTKLAMLPVFLALVALLVLAWRRFDRPPPRTAAVGPSRGRAVVAALSVTCAIVAMLGFAVVGFRGVVTGYTGSLAGVPMTAWAAAALTALALVLARAAVVRRGRQS